MRSTFVVMFEPKTGTPVNVPQSEVKSKLNKGFTKELPDRFQLKQEVQKQPQQEQSEGSEKLLINSDPLKSLTTILSIPTATAKIVKERRPYKDLENLIAKVPEVDNWANMEHLLSFDQQTPE